MESNDLPKILLLVSSKIRIRSIHTGHGSVYVSVSSCLNISARSYLNSLPPISPSPLHPWVHVVFLKYRFNLDTLAGGNTRMTPPKYWVYSQNNFTWHSRPCALHTLLTSSPSVLSHSPPSSLPELHAVPRIRPLAAEPLYLVLRSFCLGTSSSAAQVYIVKIRSPFFFPHLTGLGSFLCAPVYFFYGNDHMWVQKPLRFFLSPPLDCQLLEGRNRVLFVIIFTRPRTKPDTRWKFNKYF